MSKLGKINTGCWNLLATMHVKADLQGTMISLVFKLLIESKQRDNCAQLRPRKGYQGICVPPSSLTSSHKFALISGWKISSPLHLNSLLAGILIFRFHSNVNVRFGCRHSSQYQTNSDTEMGCLVWQYNSQDSSSRERSSWCFEVRTAFDIFETTHLWAATEIQEADF